MSSFMPLFGGCAAENGKHEATMPNSFGDAIASGQSGQSGGQEPQIYARGTKAGEQWMGAIAALEEMLWQRAMDARSVSEEVPVLGFVFASPSPAIGRSDLLAHLATWVLTVNPQYRAAIALPPAPAEEVGCFDTVRVLPLLPGDRLTQEQVCVVLTAEFSLAMACSGVASSEPVFAFSFDPQVVESVWRQLRSRVQQYGGEPYLPQLDGWRTLFAPVHPSYRTVMEFSQRLLQCLPAASAPVPAPVPTPVPTPVPARSSDRQTSDQPSSGASPLASTNPNLCLVRVKESGQAYRKQQAAPPAHVSESVPASDVELLRAIAHEIHTPLSTIRTLTRLLLKRQDLAATVLQRLKTIDRECTEQIERMELIFRAVELETSPKDVLRQQLTPISLDRLFQQCIPRWQKQLMRRNLTLDVVVPPKMPPAISDPLLLDRVLTGILENFTSSLPTASHVQMQVRLAGDRLKLQLQSNAGSTSGEAEPLKSLGRLLMFQPKTGNLSLHLGAAKHLVQSLGGRLIVRQAPHRSQSIAIFLPLLDGDATARTFGDAFSAPPCHDISSDTQSDTRSEPQSEPTPPNTRIDGSVHL